MFVRLSLDLLDLDLAPNAKITLTVRARGSFIHQVFGHDVQDLHFENIGHTDYICISFTVTNTKPRALFVEFSGDPPQQSHIFIHEFNRVLEYDPEIKKSVLVSKNVPGIAPNELSWTTLIDEDAFTNPLDPFPYYGLARSHESRIRAINTHFRSAMFFAELDQLTGNLRSIEGQKSPALMVELYHQLHTRVRHANALAPSIPIFKLSKESSQQLKQFAEHMDAAWKSALESVPLRSKEKISKSDGIAWSLLLFAGYRLNFENSNLALGGINDFMGAPNGPLFLLFTEAIIALAEDELSERRDVYSQEIQDLDDGAAGTLVLNAVCAAQIFGEISRPWKHIPSPDGVTRAQDEYEGDLADPAFFIQSEVPRISSRRLALIRSSYVPREGGKQLSHRDIVGRFGLLLKACLNARKDLSSKQDRPIPKSSQITWSISRKDLANQQSCTELSAPAPQPTQ